MVKCAVEGCRNYTNSKNKANSIRYYQFPKDNELAKVWISACGQNTEINIKIARICSDHFAENDFSLRDRLLKLSKCHLNKNAVPSLKLPVPKQELSQRSKKYEKRERNRIITEAISVSGRNDDDGVALREEPESIRHSVGTQTMVDLNCSLQLKIMDLEKEVKNLKKELKISQKENAEVKKGFKNLRTFFTEGQIKKLTCGNKRIPWNAEDISAAITLYSSGARSYRYMYRKGYPLPGMSTLTTWASKLKLMPGILSPVIDVLKGLQFSEIEKICVLSYDEMKIHESYEYDKVSDMTMKPSKYVQVVMLRGLFKSWKQPVFYDFDFAMTSSALIEIIEQLNSIEFNVVAVVSDLGATNSALRKNLNITNENPYFFLPSDNTRKIFVFADTPHLIKLIRNHFLDNGFIINGKLLTKKPIEEILLLKGNSDLKISFKVTSMHLDVARANRQKVKYAVQLFSNTVSSSIRRCVTLGKLKNKNSLECADFIKLVNDWFDIFNSKVETVDSRITKKAYGLEIEEQNKILDAMTKTMQSMKVCARNTMLPFQKGIVQNNIALKELFNYLSIKYNITYLLTGRLNQDVLENFFAVIRSKGGLADHPTSIEFKYRLRAYILGNYEYKQ